MFNLNNLTPTVRTLLFANIALYLAQISFLPFITKLGSLYPIGSPNFFPWQFVTYMFLHSGFFHILFNMFALISFGPLLEQRWGAQRFLVFWMLCGVGAGLLNEGVNYYKINKVVASQQEFHANPTGANFAEFYRNNLPSDETYAPLAQAMTRNPNNAEYVAAATTTVDAIATAFRQGGGMLGASGAVFGVLFAFAYLFPNSKLMIFPIPIPIAAKYIVFGTAMYELYQGLHPSPTDNVAHFAHLGGLLIGFIVVKYWEGGRERFY
jgi:membrane associated rhomboid family serine protease